MYHIIWIAPLCIGLIILAATILKRKKRTVAQTERKEDISHLLNQVLEARKLVRLFISENHELYYPSERWSELEKIREQNSKQQEKDNVLVLAKENELNNQLEESKKELKQDFAKARDELSQHIFFDPFGMHKYHHKTGLDLQEHFAEGSLFLSKRVELLNLQIDLYLKRVNKIREYDDLYYESLDLCILQNEEFIMRIRGWINSVVALLTSEDVKHDDLRKTLCMNAANEVKTSLSKLKLVELLEEFEQRIAS
jgi:hypothetical protein